MAVRRLAHGFLVARLFVLVGLLQLPYWRNGMRGHAQSRQLADRAPRQPATFVSTIHSVALIARARAGARAPAAPVLSGILGALGSPLANAGISPQESAAFDALAANAAAGNPYAPAIGSTAATLLAGGGPDRGGTLGDAYADLQGRLGP